MGEALKSYALDMNLNDQDSKTNVEGINFDLYFDSKNKTNKEISKDINSDDLTLFVAIDVQNGGYLGNAQIEFTNCNFKLKDKSDENKLKLGTIQSSVILELPITAIKDELFDLSLLDMVSQIKLSGKYVKNAKETQLDSTKNVKISWTAENVTEENNPIKLNQEVVTNKIYNVEETNKRVVQILVNSGIENNQYPIKSTEIELEVPALGEVYPEKVVVASYGTVATNGKDSTEFENIQATETEETTKSGNWKYNKDEQKINITVNNKAVENKVSWEKGVEDKFVVTYVYDENVNTANFESNINSKISLYETENTVLTGTSEIVKENMEAIEKDIALNISGTDVIYKGNMYIGEDTEYQTQWNTFVSYSDLAKRIVLEDLGDVVDTENLATYYKSTRINKAEAVNVLGQDGLIKIYAVENKETPIAVIDLSEENEEDYITVNYEGNISKIIIETTESVKEGNVGIINEKAIKVLNTEKIELATKLDSKVRVIMADSQSNIYVNLEKTAISNLVEPTTKIDVSLNKNVVSNQVENELTVTTILKTSDNTNKLFENPIVRVELPKDITEVSLENIALVYEDELKIKSSNVITNENGNKVIVVNLEGKQTKYNINTVQGGANIVMDLKVVANPFMADKNVDIKATCINGAENAEDKEVLKIESKKGLVTKNSLTVGTKVNKKVNNNNLKAVVKENTTASISSEIINNFGENISNVRIVGEIPTGATLTNAIVSNTQEIEIFYSVDEENWAKEVTDYGKVKSFKLVLKEMTIASLIDLKYDLDVKLDEIDSTSLESNLKVNFLINGQPKEDKIAFTLVTIAENGEEEIINEEQQEDTNINQESQENQGSVNQKPQEEQENTEVAESAVITIAPKTTVNTLYEGQIVTFEIKVKNTSSEELKNVTLDYTVPAEAVVTELTYAQGKEVEFTDNIQEKNKIYTIDSIKPNETITKEITLKIIDGVSSVTNKATLSDSQNNVITKLETTPMIVNQGKISAILSRRTNMEINLTNGSTIQYIVMVKNNTTQAINNLKITSKVPAQTIWAQDSEYNKNWKYDDSSKQIQSTISTLPAGETKEIRFEVKVDNINNNSCEAVIENTAVVSTLSGEHYETNIYASKVTAPKWDIHMVAEHNSNLKEGDNVKYIITVSNTGTRSASAYVEDILPEEIQFKKLTYYINEAQIIEDNITKEKIEILYPVEVGQTLTIVIEGFVRSLDDDITSKQISNIAKLYLGNEQYIESETIENTIIKVIDEFPEDNGTDGEIPEDEEDSGDDMEPEKPDNNDDIENDPEPEKPDNNDDTENDPEPEKPGDNENSENGTDSEEPEDNENSENNTDKKEPTDNEDGKYSISGIAWLDENKNGIKENEEKTLKMLEVVLLDSKGNQVAKTITSLAGMYQFSNLDKGEYMVIFNYDIERYAIAKYQVQSAKETNNSDAIFKVIELNNEMKTVGITDTIKINNKDIENIDIGLVENPEFDLSLNKYISKVVVTNKKGTTTYTYDNTELAKVEIGAKEIEGSVLLIEYEIEVLNDGDVNGYVTDVIDYLPKELDFSSEMNTEWYLGKDNYLHCMSLNPEPIEPGKTQTLKLTLTKTLKSDSTGTIENIAEISESGNIEAIQDNDSIAGNRKDKEDDLGKASLIVSISTGSAVMYIGVILVAMLVLGSGIYIINKKILRERI